jgi:ADP-ribosylglycohydrolase
MRAAIIGVWAATDSKKLRELVKASTRLTHTDPAAEAGALAVALAAAHGSVAGVDGIEPAAFLTTVQSELANTKMLALLEDVVRKLQEGCSFEHYLRSAGLVKGISGYINHTVPAAIFCWLQNPGDFRESVETIICAAGDTDTTAAIVGALVGASAGVQSIPQEWVDGITEFPRSLTWMRRLGTALAQTTANSPNKPIPLLWPALAFRNTIFLVIVLLHGLRRALPPY